MTAKRDEPRKKKRNRSLLLRPGEGFCGVNGDGNRKASVRVTYPDFVKVRIVKRD